MSFDRRNLHSRLSKGLTDSSRAGTAPNSPAILPGVIGCHASNPGTGSGGGGRQARSSQSCHQSPMRSPRLQFINAVSPTERSDRWLVLTEREDFANTMSAMRDFCEHRREAKARADHELRVLQRELPLDATLSPGDREHVASLIDRFLFVAVGALSRAVCKVCARCAADSALPEGGIPSRGVARAPARIVPCRGSPLVRLRRG
jgi:hypothetical protein